MSAAKKSFEKINVTLVKSLFKKLPNHQQCVRGLGLTRMHQTVTVVATPEIMGMVNKVAFMLKVEKA